MNIRKDFTDCINEANLIVRKYRVLAPKCKELISKYHGELANQCYFSLGKDPYFSITFKENTAPDNFYSSEKHKGKESRKAKEG